MATNSVGCRARRPADQPHLQARDRAAAAVPEPGQAARQPPAQRRQTSSAGSSSAAVQSTSASDPPGSQQTVVHRSGRSCLGQAASIRPRGRSGGRSSAAVARRHALGAQHDADVGGVELVVDHGAVADLGAEPEIALEQRRQRGPGGARLDLVRPAAGACRRSAPAPPAAGSRAAPGDGGAGRRAAAPGHPAGCPAGWRSRTAGRCRGPDVIGDAAPEAVDHRARAVVRIDAGAAELEAFARLREQRPEIELARRIEAALPVGDRAAHQPAGADHLAEDRGRPLRRARSTTSRWSQARSKRSMSRRQTLVRRFAAPHLPVEDAVAQRLRRSDVAPLVRQADDQIAVPSYGHRHLTGLMSRAAPLRSRRATTVRPNSTNQ